VEADIEAAYHVQGEVRDVTLRRMARVDLADHVQMFEMFTRVKLVAASIGEDTAWDCVRLLCLALSRMMHLSSEKDTKIKHLENSLVLAQNKFIRKAHPTETVGLPHAQGRIDELLRACDDTCAHMKQILSKDILAAPAASLSCSNSAFQSTVMNC
jgi:hypothetical protein